MYDKPLLVRDARRSLAQFVRRRPFEFTFVREPIGHTVSAAAELLSCARRLYCTPFKTIDSIICPAPLTRRTLCSCTSRSRCRT